MSLTIESALRKDKNTGKADMQHRHFATIATILSKMKAEQNICEYWADELRSTNCNFDRSRFLRACGY